MPYTSAYCSHCRRRTLHVEFDEKRISKSKSILAILTYGMSIPFIGLRKTNTKARACSICGTVN